MMSIVLMIFLVIGAVSATESINGSYTEDSNIIEDNDISLSANNKLEISNEDSISETNIVYSHDDNLGSNPDDEVLNITDSYYEDTYQQTSNTLEAIGENTSNLSGSSSDSVISASSSNDIVSADSFVDQSIIAASPASTKISVDDTHYTKSSTYIDVTLTDVNGKPISNQKISLVVNKKTYSAITDAKGIASVETDSLSVGTYTVSLKYGGNSEYSSVSLSKKVKVLSSVIGSDLTKDYREKSKYTVTLWNGTSVLSNAKVTFKVNCKTYTSTTNNKGQASIDINLAVGKYTITVTNCVTKEQVSHKIIVKKAKTKITAKSKTYIPAKKKGSFSVALKTKQGIALKNKKVTFKD